MPDTLPPELEEFVERELASGNYRSREDVVAAGLQLLKERQQKLEALRAEIQEGIDELDRGEVIAIDNEEQHKSFFDDIKKRGQERLADKRKSD